MVCEEAHVLLSCTWSMLWSPSAVGELTVHALEFRGTADKTEQDCMTRDAKCLKRVVHSLCSGRERLASNLQLWHPWPSDPFQGTLLRIQATLAVPCSPFYLEALGFEAQSISCFCILQALFQARFMGMSCLVGKLSEAAHSSLRTSLLQEGTTAFGCQRSQ